jgi:broad specificity phosphatase PhoE
MKFSENGKSCDGVMKDNMPPLWVLRHGQTEWNLERRCQGHMNSDLTALGRTQAADQGVLIQEILAEHARVDIVCSPLGRARETAKIILKGLDLPIRYDSRLAEAAAGEWTGLSHAEIGEKWPDLFHGDISIFEASLNAVGGEGYDALYARCADFLTDVSGPTIVITHGITSMVLRGQVCGLDYSTMEKLPFEQGCIYALNAGRETILTR